MIRESSIKLSIVVNSTARLDRDIRPKEVSALSSTTLRESQLPPLLEGLQDFSGLDADRAATEGHPQIQRMTSWPGFEIGYAQLVSALAIEEERGEFRRFRASGSRTIPVVTTVENNIIKSRNAQVGSSDLKPASVML
jgi:hypothetical protein